MTLIHLIGSQAEIIGVMFLHTHLTHHVIHHFVDALSHDRLIALIACVSFFLIAGIAK